MFVWAKAALVTGPMKSSVFVTALALALLSTACGKSKVEQCNAFIDRATQAQKVVNSLKLESEDPAELEKGAVAIETESKALGSLELKDEKLVGFRGTYASTLDALGKIMRDLAVLAKDSKDPAKADTLEAETKKINAEADKVEKQESEVVDQVNLYCSGSK